MRGMLLHRMMRGFTLVEMMLALAVLAIMAAVAVPSWQGLIASQRVGDATSALVDSLIVARSEALKRNAPTRIELEGTALDEGWRVVATVGGVDQDVRSQLALTRVDFDPGVPNIRYGTTGRFTGTTTRIEVSGAGTDRKRCIRVDTAGRPRILEGGCPP